jgi:polysaccharide export outer membrane protein
LSCFVFGVNAVVASGLRKFRVAWPVLIVLALSACGHGGDAPMLASQGSTTDPTQEYVIGPGDQLSIFVYRSPELSAEVPVRPDGRISTPLIPDMIAAGKTSTALGKDLQARLKDYVKDPIVTVMVRGFVGPFDKQIRVIGEATDPQAIPYRDHMTVLDVMIAVKGLTKFAAGNNAQIVRRVGDQRKIFNVRLSDLMKDGDIDQNVDMQPGDTLVIPQTWF